MTDQKLPLTIFLLRPDRFLYLRNSSPEPFKTDCRWLLR